MLEDIPGRIAVVSDTNVASLYKDLLPEADWYTFLEGEASKTRATKEAIEEQMFADGHDRNTTLVAFGGGVATDLGGFIASTFCRGIPLIMVPTSLIGMVDAAIGGKNGVNTPHGKNMIGSIYQPQQVIIDFNFLKTLPEKEFCNGMMEVIKYGIVADSEMYYLLELGRPTGKALEEVIYRSIEIKKEIVAKDTNDNGLRRILNFGHTFAHAFEVLTQYSLSHGEAVALGMIAATSLSNSIEFHSVETLIRSYFPDLYLPEIITPESVWEVMCRDKKSLSGAPRFVLISELGHARSFGGHYCAEVPFSQVASALMSCQRGVDCKAT